MLRGRKAPLWNPRLPYASIRVRPVMPDWTLLGANKVVAIFRVSFRAALLA